MNRQPALLIAGTHSGCGKTTVTLAVMAALTRRGLGVRPFKCGPDFIDPSLHRMVTGRVSRNLDLRMCGEPAVHRTFARHAGPDGCAVVEGVMGLFDGGVGSAASLAKSLGLPVILVIDVRAAAESVAAVAKGFDSLDPDLRLAGIICNRVGSERHGQMIAAALAGHCPAPVLGFLPRREEVAIPSRHLGLHMGEEHPLQGDGMAQLAALAETHLDLDRLLAIAGERQALAAESEPVSADGPSVRLAVARDAAFCFYYEDNLDLLRAAGAELVPFSPLADASLPENTVGLYLGGGYPELHARRLSENKPMLAALRAFADSGRPVLAECGGFMALTRSIVDLDGQDHAMAGVYPFVARMQPRLRSLGYRRATLTQPTSLGPQGMVLHGHEFHYSAIEPVDPAAATAFQLEDGRSEGYVHRNTLAGYVHLHFGRTPEAAASLVHACRHFI